MRQIIIKFLFCSILISLFISCKRDHLYYSTGNSAAIQFNIDWESTLLEPNGVSVFSYDYMSGELVSSSHISSNPNQIEVAHNMGTYDFLFFNDTEYELGNIHFEDTENINTFKIITNATTRPSYGMLSSSSDVMYATEMDVIAKKSVSKIGIDNLDMEYFIKKPSAGDYSVSQKVGVEPERITELIDIELVVRNLTSAAGAPRSHLTNMSVGFYPGLHKKHEQLMTHEFVLNNREMLSRDSKDGRISKKMVSFGPHKEGDELVHEHKLIMHFVLVNGDDHVVELDVTEIIDSSHDGVQYQHKIRAEIELPIVIGSGEGPFDPDVEDWENVEVELPI